MALAVSSWPQYRRNIRGTSFFPFKAVGPDGSVLWTDTLSESAYEYQCPAIGPDGTLYIAAGSYVYAYNGRIIPERQAKRSHMNPLVLATMSGTKRLTVMEGW
jgi:hypothetical protein